MVRVAKSAVFKRVMESLGVEVIAHMPAGSDGRRTTARAKGKVERPFRTVKEAHETLYHFHQPTSEEEANRWLARFVRTYNLGDHRAERHSRMDDWLAHLPAAGVTYEVDAELAGETVVVWWGLFDQELWVERGEERFGPYRPTGGPIPLHRYRRLRKSRREVRADRVGELAQRLTLPRSALSGEDDVVLAGTERTSMEQVPVQPFRDPDPFHELNFPTALAARRAIADEIRLPLGKLSDEDRRFIDALITRTLSRPEVMAAVRERFPQGRKGGVGTC
jgi:hypothetical protein